MTKPISATEHGLEPHWKVRLVLRAAMLHIASRSEPQWVEQQLIVGQGVVPARLVWEPIDDPGYGDTLGHVDWSEVVAISWRYSS